jgi:uncharacterized protein YlxP (DUF503 family)
MMYLPAPDECLLVGVLRLVLRIPGSRSLKDRRQVVASVRDRVQARHHAAFGEVGYLDVHEAAVVAISVVGNDSRLVRSRLDVIRADIESSVEAIVSDSSIELLSLKGSR